MTKAKLEDWKKMSDRDLYMKEYPLGFQEARAAISEEFPLLFSEYLKLREALEKIENDISSCTCRQCAWCWHEIFCLRSIAIEALALEDK